MFLVLFFNVPSQGREAGEVQRREWREYFVESVQEMILKSRIKT